MNFSGRAGNQSNDTRDRLSYNGSHGRPQHLRWDRGREQGYNRTWDDRYRYFHSRRPVKDGLTDRLISKRLSESNWSTYQQVKTDDKLSKDDMRHIINNRRNSNSDREKSTVTTSNAPINNPLFSPSKSLDVHGSISDAVKEIRNLSAESHSSGKTQHVQKIEFPSPICIPKPTSCIKKEILEDTEIQETPNKNEASQKYLNHPRLSSVSTDSIVKQETISERECNIDSSIKRSSQTEKNIPTSSCGSPSALKASKGSVATKTSGSIKLSVKSVKQINDFDKTKSPPASNESLWSRADSTQCNETHTYQSSNNEELPSSSKRVKKRSGRAQTTLEALTCSECKVWTHSSRMFWCECRVVCRACKKSAGGECTLCCTVYETSACLRNFHERIAGTIQHACRYRECTQSVKPGVKHEESCQYEPVKCFVCNHSVATARLRTHVEEIHSNRVLTDRNSDVKYSDFVQVDEAGNHRKIFCFTQPLRLVVQIALNKVDGEWNFTVSGSKCEIPTNITVTFEFRPKLKSYVFSREVKVSQAERGTLNLPSDICKDWLDGGNELNITLVVKRKRNILNKLSTKKRKGANEDMDESL